MSHILVFGAVNLDHIYTVPHIVRPGETLSSASYSLSWGGKGLNQALALCRAGAEVSLAAKIGQQDVPLLRALGEEWGLDLSRVRACDLPTGHAVIQVEPDAQNCILLHDGANGAVFPEDVSAGLEGLRPGDIVLLQNEINASAAILREAEAMGLRTALNPSPFTSDLLDWPLAALDLLILNEGEAAAMTGTDDLDTALDQLTRLCPKAQIFLTLGADGSRYACGPERGSCPASPVHAVDTTAAGDTYTGYLLTGLAGGMPVPAAMALASRAAALCVSRSGAVSSIPARAELTAD